MKKHLFITGAITALILSTICTATISNAVTTNTSTNGQTPLVIESELSSSPNFISSDESVFIITDSAGTMTKSFIGSTLNTSTAKLPLSMSIDYSLDGQDISAADLVGKSGHVKISFSFTSKQSYQDKLIPFLAITGLKLNTNKFSNVSITNGKIIKESATNRLVAGITLPGLNYDLGTDFLPDNFTVEADVTDFALDDVYTFATNEFFAALDTSKLNSLDEVINSINQLSSALDQIITGSHELSNGLDSALTGAKTLRSGTSQVNTGAHDLATGAITVNTGAHNLAAGAEQLSSGLNSLVDFDNKILDKINTTIIEAKTKITPIMEKIDTILADPDCPPELVAKFTELKTSFNHYYDQASNAITTYTGNIEQLAAGAANLKAGADKLATGTDQLSIGATTLANGTSELKSGTDSLVDGLSQLSNGGHQLTSGLNDFKTQGIDKLVKFAQNDLNAFTNNLRSTVQAAKSYRNYSKSSAKSVKFIFKTPALSKSK